MREKLALTKEETLKAFTEYAQSRKKLSDTQVISNFSINYDEKVGMEMDLTIQDKEIPS